MAQTLEVAALFAWDRARPIVASARNPRNDRHQSHRGTPDAGSAAGRSARAWSLEQAAARALDLTRDFY
jgi:hypothetical protein